MPMVILATRKWWISSASRQPKQGRVELDYFHFIPLVFLGGFPQRIVALVHRRKGGKRVNFFLLFFFEGPVALNGLEL